MPNHVTHRITVSGPHAAVLAFCNAFIVQRTQHPIVEDGTLPVTSTEFDFNRVIPMPAILNGAISGTQDARAKDQSDRALIETGHRDWYSWCVENWGTKWGAYNFEWITEPSNSAEQIEFTFDTAWSPPEPIFEEMAKRPECAPVTINIAAFDEGWGFAYTGEIADGEFFGGSTEASDEIYAQVYGAWPEHEEEEEEEEDNDG